MPCECTDMGTDLTEDDVEEIAEEMSSENMRKLMQIRQDIFDDAHGNIKRAQKRQKKYYDIQNATKEVLDIGDIVVKERQGICLERVVGWKRKEKNISLLSSK